MFRYVHEATPRKLRSANDNKLYLQNAHPKGLRYTGPRVRNSLHKDVRNAKSVKQFNRMYHKYPIQNINMSVVVVADCQYSI